MTHEILRGYNIAIQAVEPNNKGGQHVTRTSSAVRAIATDEFGSIIADITVNKRSQHKSRELALTLIELALEDIV